MKILLTGGGTGGHITPILAVAHELKQLDPTCTVIYVSEKGGKFDHLTTDCPDIDETYTIRAGKFRRYHGESLLKRVSDIKTNSLNLRDSFFVSLGVAQASRLLKKLQPDVVFLKGGFVGVPIGLAAAKQHVPIITHDSDALPGLANKLVSRWVKKHATALPASVYNYPKSKVIQVGVLVEHTYQAVDALRQHEYKAELALPPESPMLLITGGSLGAQRLNEAIRMVIEPLLQKFETLHVIHQVGKGKLSVYDGFRHERLRPLEFLRPMHVYTGAADLVVARASGNTLAELGVQGKAVIAVPSPYLAGGHQLKNAELLKEQGAAMVIQESSLADLKLGLLAHIELLLQNDEKRELLSKSLQQNTIADAAKRVAQLLLDEARGTT